MKFIAKGRLTFRDVPFLGPAKGRRWSPTVLKGGQTNELP